MRALVPVNGNLRLRLEVKSRWYSGVVPDFNLKLVDGKVQPDTFTHNCGGLVGKIEINVLEGEITSPPPEEVKADGAGV